MPGKDFEAVKPAVFDHEEPSCVAKGIETANGARRAFCDCVIHRVSLLTISGVGCGAGEEVRTGALAEGDGQHPETGVETEREVSGAGVAEPEMFTPAELAPIAVERNAEVSRKGFRQKQLAFA